MISIISTKKSWIEGTAIQQLKKLHDLDDVVSVIGLPDLHAGPVGVALATKETIYPHIVGSDAGCGMALWMCDTDAKRAKLDRWAKRLQGLDDPFEGDMSELIGKYDLDGEGYLSALGTIGHGNHFAELQAVEEVFNKELFEASGLNAKKLFLLVHSGSRGLGRLLMDRHLEGNGSRGLSVQSNEGREYLSGHDYAVTWGRANRELVAKRFLDEIGLFGESVLDLTHNSVTKETINGEELWLHRKGANPNNRGLAVIAGSRGTLSYLVKPTGDLNSSNCSIAHGAGRKYFRSEMEARVKRYNRLPNLFQTALGSRVICEDRKLLYEEAPEAYKNIKQVISDLESHGLIEVVAAFRPLITYKTRVKR